MIVGTSAGVSSSTSGCVAAKRMPKARPEQARTARLTPIRVKANTGRSNMGGRLVGAGTDRTTAQCTTDGGGCKEKARLVVNE